MLTLLMLMACGDKDTTETFGACDDLNYRCPLACESWCECDAEHAEDDDRDCTIPDDACISLCVESAGGLDWSACLKDDVECAPEADHLVCADFLEGESGCLVE